MQRRGGGHGLGAVLFTDIVGSTAIAAEMGNTRWSELVARHHRLVRRELGRFGGHEMDTAGDGFFATFERPADAIRCAVSITDAVRELGIEVRAGVSFGELEAVGKKASGLVVNTASRVMAVAGPGEVLVPASVREITTGGGISFADHGIHQLKGLDGEFRLFKVVEVDGAAAPPPLEEAEAAVRRNEIFPTGSSKRRALFIGIGAGVIALIVASALLFRGNEPEAASASGPSDESVAPFSVDRGRLDTGIPLDARGGPFDPAFAFIDQPIAAGEGGVWVLRRPFLLHIDPLHDEVRSSRFDIGFANSQSVDTGFGSVWVLSAGKVYKVHPATDEATLFVELPEPAGLMTWSFTLDDAVWIAESDGTLVRLDPFTEARDQSETGLDIDLLATTQNRLWASDVLEGALFEIDEGTLEPKGPPLSIGGSIDQLAGRGDLLWTLDRRLGAVTRVNASTRVVSPSARVGDHPSGMAVTPDAAWVGDVGGSLYRVDAETLEVERFDVGSEVLGVAVDPADDDAVWLYLGRDIE
jgi:class 3 adenylate cyclase/streptogramin lyase